MNTKYWYFIEYYECPVCGRGEIIKERRYTEKPININERFHFITSYDYCETL